MKKELTAVAVKRLKAPTDKKYQDYTDTKATGFVLRIYQTGKRTYLYRYGKPQREYTIGDASLISLAEAREQHAALRSKVIKGGDPKKEQQLKIVEQAAIPTVAEFAEVYLERWAKKKNKSWLENERKLRVDVIPFIGDMKLDQVQKKHINALLDRKEDAGALVTRNRLLSLLHKLFNFAISRGVLDVNPASKIPKAKEKQGTRILSEDEIRLLWQATSEDSNLYISTRLALRLRLITGQRSNEILNIHVDHIKDGVWLMPETKNGLAHALPITPMMQEIFNEAMPHRRNGLLLAGIKGQVMEATSLSQVFARIDWQLADGESRPTPRDLRRTFRTGLGNLNFDNFIQRKVTNHKSSSNDENSIDRVYNAYKYMTEKQQALEAWQRKIMSILSGEGAQVIPMHSLKKGGRNC